MTFPKEFAWGAASSAFQIEGAWNEEGKGPSIWDVYCHDTDKVYNRHNGDVACDHYHRYREDVALMKEMGLKAYRLSVSWPRVIPEGKGLVNAKGLDFYDRLIDELAGAGIEPFVTLFHWDLPLALHRRGGWRNRDIVECFAEYAQVVAERLGDRVSKWITFNEPTIFLLCGHYEGYMAPGERLAPRELLLATHHVFLAHGRAVQAVRRTSPQPAQIGFTHAAAPGMPVTDSAADIEAARQCTFDMPADPRKGNMHASAWWNDPVYLGRYPADAMENWRDILPEIRDGDMALIAEPTDFCGLNIYRGERVRAGAGGPEVLPCEVGAPITTMNWPVTPDVLCWGPKFFWERYGKPVYIFENGMANTDCVTEDGQVHDPQRINYISRYLQAFARAGREGVDIRGYFVWGVMDDFEWETGYSRRFGLIHVDYATQKRTPKDSFYWYRDIIASGGA